MKAKPRLESDVAVVGKILDNEQERELLGGRVVLRNDISLFRQCL